mgnify:CR=1 FL=1|tara:strand:+ start:385 stop:558 length:174 start_codon:yes stop_codon:yes gene_type:complete
MKRKTKFKNYKTFKNEADAKKALEAFQSRKPKETFSIKKRVVAGKFQPRYTIRSTSP